MSPAPDSGVGEADDPLLFELAAACRDDQVPGVSVAVVGESGLLASAAFGYARLMSRTPASATMACCWFSMSKIATATAVMMLVDRGQLDLDTPVGDILGDIWPISFADARIRHLLSHSSGLSNPMPLRWVHPAGRPRPDQRAFLAEQLNRHPRPKFTPGTRAAYSNLGFLALGEVVAVATGQPYTTWMTANLLRPLGMSGTGFTWADTEPGPAATGHQRLPRALTPMLRRFLPSDTVGQRIGKYVEFAPFEVDGAAYGGLIGPSTDAARLAALHLSHGQIDGTKLLSAAAVRLMAEIRTPGKPYDFGLGWFRHRSAGDPDHIEHLGGGAGFWNVMRLYPGRTLGVVIMSNTTRRWDVEHLADRLARQRWT